MGPLYAALEDEGLLEYGSFIPGTTVRKVLDISMPERGTKREFDAVALAELSAVDEVREVLLNYGKYIAGTGEGYRILTPGENSGQIDRYLSNAQNKIRRARKLERTSAAIVGGKPSQLSARMMLTEASMRRKPGRHKKEGDPPPVAQ